MRKLVFVPGRYGRLQVIGLAPRGPHSAPRWLCLCDCGEFIAVNAYNVRNGNSRSCGCVFKEGTHFIHGQSCKGKWSREYRAWSDMKTRVHNSGRDTFQHYGGRGITIHPVWAKSFETFLRDMGSCPPGMTLDRIDNGGPY